MAAYSDVGFRQRAVIEFPSNEGIASKEMIERLRTFYGNYSLNYGTVKRWVLHFSSDNNEITDKPVVRPVSAATTENKARVDELIRADRRITLQNIIDDIGFGKSVWSLERLPERSEIR